MNTTFVVEDFSYKVKVGTNKTRKFVIRPYTEDRLEDIIDQAVEVFTEGEPIGVYLGFTKEMYYKLMRPVIQRSFEENLGVVCYDIETGKVALVAIAYDAYNASINPVFPESTDPRVVNLFEVFAAAEQDDSVAPKKFNDLIDLWVVACSKEFQGYGLAKAVLEWMPRYHPLLSQSRVIKMTASHPRTKAIIDKQGWLTKKSLNLREYKNSKGEAVFKNIKEDFEKQGFLKNYTHIHYAILRKIAPKL